ncbi:hypothetical protein Tco_0725878 [Tanacetum coccineum]|uniref:Uncharacterized protein n=1 Tax=Tanacetum coccineum TaxID=301880 RepID=A0ABQ4YGC4_9ASTR
MVWRSASLRYETGEKKLNEVDFISQRVEMISSVPTKVTKIGVEFNLRNVDYKMVVKEIEDVLLEEMEKFGWWFEQDIDGENEDDNENKLVMVNEEG